MCHVIETVTVLTMHEITASLLLRLGLSNRHLAVSLPVHLGVLNRFHARSLRHACESDSSIVLSSCGLELVRLLIVNHSLVITKGHGGFFSLGVVALRMHACKW